MLIGYIPGVWDLLHVGHVQILQRAYLLVDTLVVGVASDLITEEDKGSKPIIPEEHRRMMVEAIKGVAFAIIYRKLDFLPELHDLSITTMIVGQTWGNEKRHLEAEEYMNEHPRRFIKLPYSDMESSSNIKERIRR